MVATSEKGLQSMMEKLDEIWNGNKCKKDKDNGDFQEQSHTDDNQSTEHGVRASHGISLLRKYNH